MIHALPMLCNENRPAACGGLQRSFRLPQANLKNNDHYLGCIG